jgi:glycerate 2-kinase
MNDVITIIVAPDSYKDCLPAHAACDIIAGSIKTLRDDVAVINKPLADGGEGTAQAMMAANNGQWIPCSVTGPLPGKQIEAGFAWFAQTKTALVEMACASGLQLLAATERNPMKTTSCGTGELLRAAAQQGAEKILLAVGGSATVDLGLGMAQALGWTFLNKKGKPVVPMGEKLLRIDRIERPHVPWTVPVEVLCDVNNPLLGVNGAAKVFAPQKGASRADVVLLEVGFVHVSELIIEQLQIDVQTTPGTGAAGGLAAGAIAFLNARLKSGIDTIMQENRLEEAMQSADWVITGEGRFDAQSLQGKVISGLIRASQGTSAKIAVLAGQVDLEPKVWQEHGIAYVAAITPEGIPLEEALAKGAANLADAATDWVKEVLRC